MQVRARVCRPLWSAAAALLAPLTLVVLTVGAASVVGSLHVADGPGASESPAAPVATEWLSGDGIGDPGAIAVQPRRGPLGERVADAGMRLASLTVVLLSATAAVFVARGRSRLVADRESVAGGPALWAGAVGRRAPPVDALAA